MLILSYILMAAAWLGLVYELRRDLMMLQQNSYFNKRYRNWLRESGDTTSGWRLADSRCFSCAEPSGGARAGLLVMGIFGVVTMLRLCFAKYKKPLVWTARARRIYAVAALVCVAVAAVAMILFGGDTTEGGCSVWPRRRRPAIAARMW